MWKPLLRLNFNKILLTYKIIQQTLEVKRQQFYIYIYIYIADDSNNNMFRPLTDHHQVVHPKKTVGRLYNVISV